jgi:hypothetical protein
MAKMNKQGNANTFFKPTSNRSADRDTELTGGASMGACMGNVLILLTNNVVRDRPGKHSSIRTRECGVVLTYKARVVQR